ncbi:MAG: dihydroflavonol-4-reductase [Myxococcota bacterium]|jgi:dihydroflavonol-4-reductase
MKVAVTGATGLLGGYLVRSLLARGATPIAVVRDAELAAPLTQAGVEVRCADLANVQELTAAFHGADCVINSAALVGFRPYPFSRYLDVNVEGAIHVFKAMRAAGVERAIQVSSVGVYRGHRAPIDEDNPRHGEEHRMHRFNGYKISKSLAEATAWRYATKYDLLMTTLRPAVLYGAFDRHFGVWHKRAMRMRPFRLYPNAARFCLVYAGDVAEAAMLSLENEKSLGRAYNVAGEYTRLRDFADEWASQTTSKPRSSLSIPVWYRRRYSSKRIERELGWTPRTYAQGIHETLEIENDG